MKFNFLKKKKTGYALLEMVFYISLLVIVSVLVINSMITMMKSFKETRILSELTQNSAIVEKISREIKQAYQIYSINSTNLSLNTRDENEVEKIISFNLVGNDIQYLENGTLIGNLNSNNININSLSFTTINTNQGQAIKFYFSCSSVLDSLNRNIYFYNSAVLRGTYLN